MPNQKKLKNKTLNVKEKNSQSQSLENFFPMHCFLKLLEDVLHQNEKENQKVENKGSERRESNRRSRKRAFPGVSA